MCSIKWQYFNDLGWPLTPQTTQIFAFFVDCHGNVPWQVETCYRSIICTKCAFIWCKECENRCIRSRDIRWNTPVFLATSYLTFINEPCQLWSYWTEFHEIFTRYTYVQASYALLSCIARPWYCNSFSSSSVPNAGGISRHWYIFATLFGCHGNVPR